MQGRYRRHNLGLLSYPWASHSRIRPTVVLQDSDTLPKQIYLQSGLVFPQNPICRHQLHTVKANFNAKQGHAPLRTQKVGACLKLGPQSGLMLLSWQGRITEKITQHVPGRQYCGKEGLGQSSDTQQTQAHQSCSFSAWKDQYQNAQTLEPCAGGAK